MHYLPGDAGCHTGVLGVVTQLGDDLPWAWLLRARSSFCTTASRCSGAWCSSLDMASCSLALAGSSSALNFTSLLTRNTACPERLRRANSMLCSVMLSVDPARQRIIITTWQTMDAHDRPDLSGLCMRMVAQERKEKLLVLHTHATGTFCCIQALSKDCCCVSTSIGWLHSPATLWWHVVRPNGDRYENSCSPASPTVLQQPATEFGWYNTCNTHTKSVC